MAVADLRARGVRTVVGAGDGFADRCLLERVDAGFARAGSFLARWAAGQGVPHQEFETLDAAAALVRAA